MTRRGTPDRLPTAGIPVVRPHTGTTNQDHRRFPRAPTTAPDMEWAWVTTFLSSKLPSIKHTWSTHPRQKKQKNHPKSTAHLIMTHLNYHRHHRAITITIHRIRGYHFPQPSISSRMEDIKISRLTHTKPLRVKSEHGSGPSDSFSLLLSSHLHHGLPATVHGPPRLSITYIFLLFFFYSQIRSKSFLLLLY